MLGLIARDLSLRESAAEPYASHNTVKTQTRSIYRKLRVSSRHEAVAIARHTGCRSVTLRHCGTHSKKWVRARGSLTPSTSRSIFSL